jgi:hypothetical protein
METTDLSNRFMYHPAKDSQPERYGEVRKRFLELANFINEFCPESREKSLAITNLEQAQFWANASIARNE